MQRGKNPYKQLGERLNEIRRTLKETIPEVSGAVELETDMIVSYERGETRPSEDILGLLISHFEVKDDEADELWDLAGYGTKHDTAQEEMPSLPTLVMIPMDSRVIYTDTANVSINNFGVVMNFMQNGPAGQPVAVSRVGMSLDHAKSVLEVLAKTIEQAEASKKPKQLPSTKKNSKKTK